MIYFLIYLIIYKCKEILAVMTGQIKRCGDRSLQVLLSSVQAMAIHPHTKAALSLTHLLNVACCTFDYVNNIPSFAISSGFYFVFFTCTVYH